MLTTTETRLLRVLVALRDATGAKTRTPVSEVDVAERLTADPEIDGSVADELDDLERQGFALIETDRSGVRRVQMTAPGKIKAEEFTQMMARAGIPVVAAAAVPTPAPATTLAAALHLRAGPPTPVEPPSAPARAPHDPVAVAPAPGGQLWGRAVGEVLDAVTQTIALLPPDTATVVTMLLDDARGAVSAGSAARARRTLAALGAYLGDPASGALGNVLAAQMRAVAPQLGD